MVYVIDTSQRKGLDLYMIIIEGVQSVRSYMISQWLNVFAVLVSLEVTQQDIIVGLYA